MCRTYRTPPRSQTVHIPTSSSPAPVRIQRDSFSRGMEDCLSDAEPETRTRDVAAWDVWSLSQAGQDCVTEACSVPLAHCACSFHVERLQNAKTTTAHAPIRRGTLHCLGLKPTIHGYDLESTARPKCANCRHLRQTSLRTIRPTNAIDRRNRRQTRSHHLNHRQNVEQRQRVERRGQELTTGWCGALETSSRRIPTATTIPTA